VTREQRKSTPPFVRPIAVDYSALVSRRSIMYVRAVL